MSTITPDGLEQRMREVVQQMQEGKTSGIDELKQLLEAGPASSDLLGHLAWAYCQQGRHAEALEAYRQSAELSPEHDEIRWRLADRLVALDRLDEALESYRLVLGRSPECEDARMGVRYVLYLKQHQLSPRPPDASGSSAKLTPLQESNRETNAREFKGRARRLASLPPRLYLESTTRCNFYCQICRKGHAPYFAEDLHEQVRQKVREQLLPTNTWMSITGYGEPTLARNFDSILEMALANGSEVHFVTNASLLSFEQIERLARGNVHVVISVDGGTKATLEKIRRGANFELLCEKLAMIKKLRDVYLSHRFSDFAFHFVALRENLPELAQVVRLAARYGIFSVGVVDYAFQGTSYDAQSPRLDPANANRCLKEAEKVAAQLGVELSHPGYYEESVPAGSQPTLWKKIRSTQGLLPRPGRFAHRCTSPWQETYVCTDGTVTACCGSRDSLGNLRQSSFPSIWNGWRYRLLRLRIDSPLPPLYCRECVNAWGINAGTPGHAKAREGLVIKALYQLEKRLKALGAALRAKLKLTPPPLQPNYSQGRPIREKDEG